MQEDATLFAPLLELAMPTIRAAILTSLGAIGTMHWPPAQPPSSVPLHAMTLLVEENTQCEGRGSNQTARFLLCSIARS